MGKIVRQTIKLGQKPTKEQLLEIADASSDTFDEDSPEFSYDEMRAMVEAAKKKREDQKKELVTLRLSASALRKAKATGKGYTGFLGRLIENALDDRDLVTRSL